LSEALSSSSSTDGDVSSLNSSISFSSTYGARRR